jgi:hypothetical protein
MAWGSLPAASLNFTLEDATGSSSKLQFHIPVATTIAVALVNASDLRPLVEAVTDCVVVAQSITYSMYDPLHGPATAGSRIENKGVVIMRAANGRASRVAIPGIKEALLNPSGSIDRANADFAALFTGILDPTAIFCGADGSDLVGVDKAYQAFRHSTKAMLPTDR